jgi:hypothetical protein
LERRHRRCAVRVAASARRLAGNRVGKRRGDQAHAGPPQGAVDPGTIRFFPFVADKIDPSGPQPVTREGNAYVVALPVAHTATGPSIALPAW